MTAAAARAVRFDRYGGREVLYVADVDLPTAGPGEVVVEVRAAGINPGEAAIRTGALHEMFPATFPSGEGSDLAGVVTALGPGVTEFSPGDEVLGFSFRRSSDATHAAVPVGQLIHKPPQLSWEVAGSLYVVGVTAYAAVRAVSRSRVRRSPSRRRRAGWAASSCNFWCCARRGCSASPGRPTPTGCAPMASPRSPMGTDWPTGCARRHPPGSTRSSTSSAPTTCSSRSTSASHPSESTPSSRSEGRRSRRQDGRQRRGVDTGGAGRDGRPHRQRHH